MNTLNNFELLDEMERDDQQQRKDEFPFVTDMTSMWKSLVSSLESRLGKLKVNRKLNRLRIRRRRV